MDENKKNPTLKNPKAFKSLEFTFMLLATIMIFLFYFVYASNKIALSESFNTLTSVHTQSINDEVITYLDILI